MTEANVIGFGLLIGSLISMLTLIIIFGNGLEVLCVLPSILLGMYLYNKK